MSTAEIEALANDPEVKPLIARNWLRWHQRVEREQEIANVEQVLGDPAQRKALADPGRLAKQNAERKQTLIAQTPPPVGGLVRDKAAKLERACLDYVREGMLSQEELRHAPTGAPDRLRKWETAKKSAVLMWKRLRLVLNPDADDRDLCNLERYRPARQPRGGLDGAEIPVQFTLSDEAKANYDAIDWGRPETIEEMQARAKAAGFTLKVERHQRLAEKPNRRAPTVEVCGLNGCTMTFRGRAATAQKVKHQKRTPHPPLSPREVETATAS